MLRLESGYILRLDHTLLYLVAKESRMGSFISSVKITVVIQLLG